VKSNFSKKIILLQKEVDDEIHCLDEVIPFLKRNLILIVNYLGVLFPLAVPIKFNFFFRRKLV
tara:strand:+ start:120 stop:308 length:189 start_codon:yes stop_codon:yes gene_type:complete